MTTLPSDALLATTLRAIGDGVISCDREGRIVLMNTIAEELTGWTEQEARGHLFGISRMTLHRYRTKVASAEPTNKVETDRDALPVWERKASRKRPVLDVLYAKAPG